MAGSKGTCCIAGGGPAGMMLGYLLARVTVVSQKSTAKRLRRLFELAFMPWREFVGQTFRGLTGISSPH